MFALAPGRCSSNAHLQHPTIRNPLSALSLSLSVCPTTSLPMAFSLRPGRDWPLWSGLYGHQYPLPCLLPPSLACQLESCPAAHLRFATISPEKVCRTTSDTMPFTTYFLDYKIPPQCSIADHLVLEVFEPNKIPVKMSFNVFLLYQRKISGSGSRHLNIFHILLHNPHSSHATRTDFTPFDPLLTTPKAHQILSPHNNSHRKVIRSRPK